MANFTNLPCLVLNPDFTPMEIFPKLKSIPVRDALPKVLAGTCYVVAEYDQKVQHPTLDIKWPSVIVRKEQEHWDRKPGLSRELLWFRDNLSCTYCGQELETYRDVTFDHIVPRSQGGPKSWENITSACESCNSAKANKPAEGRWKPKVEPYVPTYWSLLAKRKKFPIVIHHESWADFLPDWEGGINLIEPKGAFS